MPMAILRPRTKPRRTIRLLLRPAKLLPAPLPVLLPVVLAVLQRLQAESNSSSGFLFDYCHCIAIGIESVVAADCLPVAGEQLFPAAEC